MVGTGRFELPTPRTPSECSTRLSHVPTYITTGQRCGVIVILHASRARCHGSQAPTRPFLLATHDSRLATCSNRPSSAHLIRTRISLAVHWLTQHLHYPVAVIGTVAAIVLAIIIKAVGDRIVDAHYRNPKEHYNKRSLLSTLVALGTLIAIIVLWARLFEQKGTFFGLVGAGLAVALREPLLSIAGRIAISAGGMYSVGDRIELAKMSGDVVHIGFFYTRMMEIGNWIHGDQASGRIVQFSNSEAFGKPIFNYTRDFSYIWDEVSLPVTYDSNVAEATGILTDVGGQYTREFLQGAQAELEKMRRAFLLPKFELEPQVYIKITSNWIELAMRYVVDPKKRRNATSFIYSEVFKRVQQRDDIQIASETMDLTVRRPQEQKELGPEEQAA